MPLKLLDRADRLPSPFPLVHINGENYSLVPVRQLEQEPTSTPANFIPDLLKGVGFLTLGLSCLFIALAAFRSTAPPAPPVILQPPPPPARNQSCLIFCGGGN